MDKKKGFLKYDIEKIKEIENLLLEISIPKEKDFEYLIKLINEIENNMFIIGNIVDIEYLSVIRKTFVYIEKYPEQYFRFKYDLFNSIINLEELYKQYMRNNLSKYKVNLSNEKLQEYIKKLNEGLEEINKNKEYYYIKFKLDVNAPYFYLSRRNILTRLKEKGKAYNYIPLSLDDDRYDYFITDYKIDNKYNVRDILNDIEEDDDAIISLELNEIKNNKNIYNIKIFFENIEENDLIYLEKIFAENDILLNITQYENMLDIYVNCKNQLEVINKIVHLENKKIHLILSKNINNRETRVFAINGVNKGNISEIKAIIEKTIVDKKIVDIIYKEPIDFFGKQFLEFLKKYNIETGLFKDYTV